MHILSQLRIFLGLWCPMISGSHTSAYSPSTLPGLTIPLYVLTFSLLFRRIFLATGVFSYIQSLPPFSDGNLPLLSPKGPDGIPLSVVQIITFFSCLQDESLPHLYMYTFNSQQIRSESRVQSVLVNKVL